MSYILHLIIGAGLSFIGSLPFGIINMTVAHTAIYKRLSAALLVALGAIVVEFFQVIIALKFTYLFDESGTVSQVLKILAIIVFLVAGVYYLFFARTKSPEKKEENPGNLRNEFLKGMVISSLNVMAIPFWIFYGAYLTANECLVHENKYILIFAVGTMAGTFILLFCYALLGKRIMRKSELVTLWVNRSVGTILVILGIYQLTGMVGRI
jgi:threonine/homoserine/homoserine lactone efflux protein